MYSQLPMKMKIIVVKVLAVVLAMSYGNIAGGTNKSSVETSSDPNVFLSTTLQSSTSISASFFVSSSVSFYNLSAPVSPAPFPPLSSSFASVAFKLDNISIEAAHSTSSIGSLKRFDTNNIVNLTSYSASIELNAKSSGDNINTESISGSNTSSVYLFPHTATINYLNITSSSTIKIYSQNVIKASTPAIGSTSSFYNILSFITAAAVPSTVSSHVFSRIASSNSAEASSQLAESLSKSFNQINSNIFHSPVVSSRISASLSSNQQSSLITKSKTTTSLLFLPSYSVASTPPSSDFLKAVHSSSLYRSYKSSSFVNSTVMHYLSFTNNTIILASPSVSFDFSYSATSFVNSFKTAHSGLPDLKTFVLHSSTMSSELLFSTNSSPITQSVSFPSAAATLDLTSSKLFNPTPPSPFSLNVSNIKEHIFVSRSLSSELPVSTTYFSHYVATSSSNHLRTFPSILLTPSPTISLQTLTSTTPLPNTSIENMIKVSMANTSVLSFPLVPLQLSSITFMSSSIPNIASPKVSTLATHIVNFHSTDYPPSLDSNKPVTSSPTVSIALSPTNTLLPTFPVASISRIANKSTPSLNYSITFLNQTTSIPFASKSITPSMSLDLTKSVLLSPKNSLELFSAAHSSSSLTDTNTFVFSIYTFNMNKPVTASPTTSLRLSTSITSVDKHFYQISSNISNATLSYLAKTPSFSIFQSSTIGNGNYSSTKTSTPLASNKVVETFQHTSLQVSPSTISTINHVNTILSSLSVTPKQPSFKVSSQYTPLSNSTSSSLPKTEKLGTQSPTLSYLSNISSSLHDTSRYILSSSTSPATNVTKYTNMLYLIASDTIQPVKLSQERPSSESERENFKPSPGLAVKDKTATQIPTLDLQLSTSSTSITSDYNTINLTAPLFKTTSSSLPTIIHHSTATPTLSSQQSLSIQDIYFSTSNTICFNAESSCSSETNNIVLPSTTIASQLLSSQSIATVTSPNLPKSVLFPLTLLSQLSSSSTPVAISSSSIDNKTYFMPTRTVFSNPSDSLASISTSSSIPHSNKSTKYPLIIIPQLPYSPTFILKSPSLFDFNKPVTHSPTVSEQLLSSQTSIATYQSLLADNQSMIYSSNMSTQLLSSTTVLARISSFINNNQPAMLFTVYPQLSPTQTSIATHLSVFDNNPNVTSSVTMPTQILFNSTTVPISSIEFDNNITDIRSPTISPHVMSYSTYVTTSSHASDNNKTTIVSTTVSLKLSYFVTSPSLPFDNNKPDLPSTTISTQLSSFPISDNSSPSLFKYITSITLTSNVSFQLSSVTSSTSPSSSFEDNKTVLSPAVVSTKLLTLPISIIASSNVSDNIKPITFSRTVASQLPSNATLLISPSASFGTNKPVLHSHTLSTQLSSSPIPIINSSSLFNNTKTVSHSRIESFQMSSSTTSPASHLSSLDLNKPLSPYTAISSQLPSSPILFITFAALSDDNNPPTLSSTLYFQLPSSTTSPTSHLSSFDISKHLLSSIARSTQLSSLSNSVITSSAFPDYYKPITPFRTVASQLPSNTALPTSPLALFSTNKLGLHSILLPTQLASAPISVINSSSLFSNTKSLSLSSTVSSQLSSSTTSSALHLSSFDLSSPFLLSTAISTQLSSSPISVITSSGLSDYNKLITLSRTVASQPLSAATIPTSPSTLFSTDKPVLNSTTLPTQLSSSPIPIINSSSLFSNTKPVSLFRIVSSHLSSSTTSPASHLSSFNLSKPLLPSTAISMKLSSPPISVITPSGLCDYKKPITVSPTVASQSLSVATIATSPSASFSANKPVLNSTTLTRNLFSSSNSIIASSSLFDNPKSVSVSPSVYSQLASSTSFTSLHSGLFDLSKPILTYLAISTQLSSPPIFINTSSVLSDYNKLINLSRTVASQSLSTATIPTAPSVSFPTNKPALHSIPFPTQLSSSTVSFITTSSLFDNTKLVLLPRTVSSRLSSSASSAVLNSSLFNLSKPVRHSTVISTQISSPTISVITSSSLGDNNNPKTLSPIVEFQSSSSTAITDLPSDFFGTSKPALPTQLSSSPISIITSPSLLDITKPVSLSRTVSFQWSYSITSANSHSSLVDNSKLISNYNTKATQLLSSPVSITTSSSLRDGNKPFTFSYIVVSHFSSSSVVTFSTSSSGSFDNNKPIFSSTTIPIKLSSSLISLMTSSSEPVNIKPLTLSPYISSQLPSVATSSTSPSTSFDLNKPDLPSTAISTHISSFQMSMITSSSMFDRIQSNTFSRSESSLMTSAATSSASLSSLFDINKSVLISNTLSMQPLSLSVSRVTSLSLSNSIKPVTLSHSVYSQLKFSVNSAISRSSSFEINKPVLPSTKIIAHLTSSQISLITSSIKFDDIKPIATSRTVSSQLLSSVTSSTLLSRPLDTNIQVLSSPSVSTQFSSSQMYFITTSSSSDSINLNTLSSTVYSQLKSVVVYSTLPSKSFNINKPVLPTATISTQPLYSVTPVITLSSLFRIVKPVTISRAEFALSSPPVITHSSISVIASSSISDSIKPITPSSTIPSSNSDQLVLSSTAKPEQVLSSSISPISYSSVFDNIKHITPYHSVASQLLSAVTSFNSPSSSFYNNKQVSPSITMFTQLSAFPISVIASSSMFNNIKFATLSHSVSSRLLSFPSSPNPHLSSFDNNKSLLNFTTLSTHLSSSSILFIPSSSVFDNIKPVAFSHSVASQLLSSETSLGSPSSTVDNNKPVLASNTLSTQFSSSPIIFIPSSSVSDEIKSVTLSHSVASQLLSQENSLNSPSTTFDNNELVLPSTTLSTQLSFSPTFSSILDKIKPITVPSQWLSSTSSPTLHSSSIDVSKQMLPATTISTQLSSSPSSANSSASLSDSIKPVTLSCIVTLQLSSSVTFTTLPSSLLNINKQVLSFATISTQLTSLQISVIASSKTFDNIPPVTLHHIVSSQKSASATSLTSLSSTSDNNDPVIFSTTILSQLSTSPISAIVSSLIDNINPVTILHTVSFPLSSSVTDSTISTQLSSSLISLMTSSSLFGSITHITVASKFSSSAVFDTSYISLSNNFRPYVSSSIASSQPFFSSTLASVSFYTNIDVIPTHDFYSQYAYTHVSTTSLSSSVDMSKPIIHSSATTSQHLSSPIVVRTNSSLFSSSKDVTPAMSSQNIFSLSFVTSSSSLHDQSKPHSITISSQLVAFLTSVPDSSDLFGCNKSILPSLKMSLQLPASLISVRTSSYSVDSNKTIRPYLGTFSQLSHSATPTTLDNTKTVIPSTKIFSLMLSSTVFVTTSSYSFDKKPVILSSNIFSQLSHSSLPATPSYSFDSHKPLPSPKSSSILFSSTTVVTRFSNFNTIAFTLQLSSSNTSVNTYVSISSHSPDTSKIITLNAETLDSTKPIISSSTVSPQLLYTQPSITTFSISSDKYDDNKSVKAYPTQSSQLSSSLISVTKSSSSFENNKAVTTAPKHSSSPQTTVRTPSPTLSPHVLYTPTIVKISSYSLDTNKPVISFPTMSLQLSSFPTPVTTSSSLYKNNKSYLPSLTKSLQLSSNKPVTPFPTFSSLFPFSTIPIATSSVAFETTKPAKSLTTLLSQLYFKSSFTFFHSSFLKNKPIIPSNIDSLQLPFSALSAASSSSSVYKNEPIKASPTVSSQLLSPPTSVSKSSSFYNTNKPAIASPTLPTQLSSDNALRYSPTLFLQPSFSATTVTMLSSLSIQTNYLKLSLTSITNIISLHSSSSTSLTSVSSFPVNNKPLITPSSVSLQRSSSSTYSIFSFKSKPNTSSPTVSSQQSFSPTRYTIFPSLSVANKPHITSPSVFLEPLYSPGSFITSNFSVINKPRIYSPITSSIQSSSPNLYPKPSHLVVNNITIMSSPTISLQQSSFPTSSILFPSSKPLIPSTSITSAKMLSFSTSFTAPLSFSVNNTPLISTPIVSLQHSHSPTSLTASLKLSLNNEPLISYPIVSKQHSASQSLYVNNESHISIIYSPIVAFSLTPFTTSSSLFNTKNTVTPSFSNSRLVILSSTSFLQVMSSNFPFPSKPVNSSSARPLKSLNFSTLVPTSVSALNTSNISTFVLLSTLVPLKITFSTTSVTKDSKLTAASVLDTSSPVLPFSSVKLLPSASSFAITSISMALDYLKISQTSTSVKDITLLQLSTLQRSSTFATSVSKSSSIFISSVLTIKSSSSALPSVSLSKSVNFVTSSSTVSPSGMAPVDAPTTSLLPTSPKLVFASHSLPTQENVTTLIFPDTHSTYRSNLRNTMSSPGAYNSYLLSHSMQEYSAPTSFSISILPFSTQNTYFLTPSPSLSQKYRTVATSISSFSSYSFTSKSVLNPTTSISYNLVSSISPCNYSRSATSSVTHLNDEYLRVEQGQLTFDAEGDDNPSSKYFSRVPHLPDGRSGVTIGRGYDLSEHTKDEILEDMRNAGVDISTSKLFAGATGKKGDAANIYIKNSLRCIIISHRQQKTLFQSTYQKMAEDVKRIVNKDDVVAAYGRTDWNTLCPAIKDILVDLRYRGDFTPLARGLIQRAVSSNDLENITGLMSNKKLWEGVPQDRFDRRKEFLEKYLQTKILPSKCLPLPTSAVVYPPIKVNGNFSSWSNWTRCSKSCGSGFRQRMRTCTSPPPTNGGSNCSGLWNQTSLCNTFPCPVNGGWALWSQWTYCNRPCGTGNESRIRSCTNPPPLHGGKDCEGESEQKRTCNTDKCPEVEVAFFVRFPYETWSPAMADFNSSDSLSMQNKIASNVRHIYEKDKTFKSVEIISLSKGSVAANFNVTYLRMDSIQLLHIQETITVTKHLNTMPVELQNISTNIVSNDAPTITYALNSSSTSVRLKWTTVPISSLNGGTPLGYQVFYKKTGQRYRQDWLKAVSFSTIETDIEGLEKYTIYTFRIVVFTKNGNGVASQPVTVSTDEDTPSQSPNNMKAAATSSTKIAVNWQPIDTNLVHGVLLGYNVSYGRHVGGDVVWSYRLVSEETLSLSLEPLHKFVFYSVYVCGYTSKGCGEKTHIVTLRTFEDVPTKAPKLRGLNRTSDTAVQINWDPVPWGHINGILLGYKLTYGLTKTSEKAMIYKETTVEFGHPITTYKLAGLTPYSVYKFKITARTRIGYGPTDVMFLETCRCPVKLYTNYRLYEPYVTKKDNLIKGIFSPVKKMIEWACGDCTNGHGLTFLDLSTNGKGKQAPKTSVVEFMGDIDDIPQLSFPVPGNKHLVHYMAHYAYVHFVDTPGLIFVTILDPPGISSQFVFSAVFACYPVFLISMCMMFVAGFVVWVLETRTNHAQYPHGFLNGITEGIWWSFATMTTVGYGDRFTTGVLGRLFAGLWMVIGIILVIVMVGSISTSLTTVTIDTSVSLYGTRVATIRNSSEFRKAVLANAIVNPEGPYDNVQEIRDALKERTIKGALLDTYVAAHHREELFDHEILANKMFRSSSGYGIVLSGEALYVEERCREYISRNMAALSKNVERNTKTIQAPATNEAIERSTGLFDVRSQLFIASFIGTIVLFGLALAAGLVWHYCYWLPLQRAIDKDAVKLAEQKKMWAFEMTAVVTTFKENATKKLTKMLERHRKLQIQVLRKRKQQQASLQDTYWSSMAERDRYIAPKYVEVEIGSSHGITLTSTRPIGGLSPRPGAQGTGAKLNKLLSPPSRPCVFVMSPNSGEYTQETEHEINTRF